MQVSIPFLRTDFPELDHLAADERQIILQACINSAEMQRLSGQQLRTVRLAFLMIPIGIVAALLWAKLGLPIGGLPWLIWFVAGFLLFSFVASIIVFHLRSSKYLKKCVAQQLAQRA